MIIESYNPRPSLPQSLYLGLNDSSPSPTWAHAFCPLGIPPATSPSKLSFHLLADIAKEVTAFLLASLIVGE